MVSGIIYKIFNGIDQHQRKSMDLVTFFCLLLMKHLPYTEVKDEIKFLNSFHRIKIGL